MMVNLIHLRAFYMVAKYRSFTLAGKELDVSQPTLSLQVQELEKHCGFPLLIRDTKHVELTHEGQVIYHFAEKISDLADEIANTIADINNLNLGTLKIGATFLTLANLVPGIISPVKSRFPGLKIQLFSGSAKEILRKVIDFEYHIGIIGRLPYPNNIICKQLQRLKLYFISKDKMAEKIYLRDLAKYPVILQSEGAATRDIIINEFRNRNIPLNIQIETEDAIIMKSMVQQCMGGAFMPLYAIEDDLKERKFEVTELIDGIYYYLDAIFLKERKKSNFIRIITSVVDDLKCFHSD
jgi:DNA-binding transcriptional LysR family regulator